MKVKQEYSDSRWEGLRRLAFNKWSLTFAVMLIMLSVYITMEQPIDDEVLYVSDTLPYEVQKVSGEGELTVLPTDEVSSADSDNDIDKALDEAGQFSINSDSDFFINYRLEREKARSRQLELLQGLIDDESTSDEVRAKAQERIIAQAEAIEQELMLESILVAKYGGEAAVFIQPNKANAVLNINPDKMSDKEAEKIAALVDNYTGIGYENVVVVLKD